MSYTLQTEVPFDAQGLVDHLATNAQVAPDDNSVVNVDGQAIEAAFSDYTNQLSAYLTAVNPDITMNEVIGEKTIIVEEPPVLPLGLPYTLLVKGGVLATLANEHRYRVKVELFDSAINQATNSPSLTYTTSLAALNTQRLGVTYRPAAPEDEQLIQDFKDQGAATLPVYLVRMTPELQIDGNTVVAGSTYQMGSDHFWNVTLIDPQGFNTSTESFDSIVGDEIVFGIDGNGLTSDFVLDVTGGASRTTAADDLHIVALNYWIEYDAFSDFAARFHNSHHQRLPSVGLFAFPLEVSYFFGLPRNGNYKARIVDVDRALASIVAPDAQTLLAITTQIGSLGSYFEGSVLDQIFLRPQGSSVSALQLLGDASAQGIPIFKVDNVNIGNVLPQLNVSSATISDIQNAIAADLVVTVPQSQITHGSWTGSGYVILDPVTGVGAYRIEGGLNGANGAPCIPKLSPEAADFVSGAVAAQLVRLTGGLASATGQGAARLLSYFATNAITAFLAIEFAGPVLTAFALLMIYLLVYHMVQLLIAELEWVSGSSAPDCECLPEPKPSECECTFKRECPHAGGDQIHNICADEAPPNLPDFQGCDVLVTHPSGKSARYDAYNGIELWEIKTGKWRDFLQFTDLEPNRDKIFNESDVARLCNKDYIWGVADPDWKRGLDNWVPGFSPQVADEVRDVDCVLSP